MVINFMAYRECNGRFFHITTTSYYRCMWDSAVMKLDWFPELLKNGDECPNCKRIIDGTDIGDAESYAQFKAFRFSDGTSVVL